MRYSLIFIALAFVGALNAQLPIRNYLFLNQDSIVVLLDSEGLEYEVYETDGNEDSYGYDYNYEDEEVYYEDTSYYDGAAYGEEEESVQDEEMAIVEAPVVSEVVPDTIPTLAGDYPLYDLPVEVLPAKEVDISVFSSQEFGYTGNDASFYLLNDTCYLVQYNWYSDPFVLESVRKVMDMREDFSPCFDMKDCWIQEKPGEEIVYYWNLFEKYEGDENWKVLRIEAEPKFEENRWWYQFSEGKTD